MAEADTEHAVVREEGRPTCVCGQSFDTNAELIVHVTGQPLDQEFQLLMHQLIDTLGNDFMESVARHITRQGVCPGDHCICAPLAAYTALYYAGWAIVPLEEARQLHALRGRVN